MNSGARNADVRIAAINARKIQAALRQGIDAKRVLAAYKRTSPNASKNPVQDRARARAWAMLNMRINNEPLLEVLQRTWAEGFVLGEAYGDEAIARAREAKKAASDYIDWDNWRPGDAATATLLRPPKAFQELLGRARVTIKDLDQTGYDRVGTALADSIEQGLSDTRAARLINDAIGSPSRALTIAITETNRAMSLGAITRYKAAKLEQMEWSTSDPCDICKKNNGQVIDIGGTFNSNHTQPPAHPHCRCALLPVIPEFEPNANGVVDVAPQPTDLTYDDAVAYVERRKLFDRSTLPPGSDPNLYVARDMRGYNDLPTVLSPDDFDALEGKTVFRGVEKKKFVDDFLEGDNFAGQGVYGNGSYASDAREYATQFAGPNKDLIMELKITPDMRVIDVREMNDWRKGFTADLDARKAVLQARRKALPLDAPNFKADLAQIDADLETLQEVQRYLGQDLGTLATLRGYDAISVPAGQMGLSILPAEADEFYYVILNRAKVVAKGAA